MDEPLPNPPAELKAVLPFVQRANELRTADNVIAYWCCYYAAQLGIAGNAKDNEAKMYLLTLMDTLEDLKSKLSDNDAVTNDAASSAYVENFALKVFVGADNEDRAGKATRATPKKFLAASQFMELLKIFGTLEPEMQEKIKYAKWKAADIAKAFKEGRKPQAGPAGGDPKVEAAQVEAAMAPSAVDSREEEEYLAREMAKLTAAAPEEPPPNPNGLGMSRTTSSTSNKDVQAPSSIATHTNPPTSASPDAEEMWKSTSKPTTDTLSRSSSAQRRDSLDRPQIQPSSSHMSVLGSSPGSRPLPTPPQRDGLPIPPISAHQQMLGSSPGVDQVSAGGGPGAAPASFWGASAPTLDQGDFAPTSSVLPSVPSDYLPSFGPSEFDSGHPAIERIDPPRSPGAPSLPSTPAGQLPGTPGAHASPSIPPAPPTAPRGPPVPPSDSFAPRPAAPPSVAAHTQTRSPAPSAPSAPAVAPSTVFPESLDPKLSTRVQKLAKGAASAVDFEDLETARIQLRQALDILEGRTTL